MLKWIKSPVNAVLGHNKKTKKLQNTYQLSKNGYVAEQIQSFCICLFALALA